MWKPSGISFAARTTQQPIRSCVTVFSITRRVCAGRFSAAIIMAPNGFTLRVRTSSLASWPFKFTYTLARMRNRTRWLRRRSSPPTRPPDFCAPAEGSALEFCGRSGALEIDCWEECRAAVRTLVAILVKPSYRAGIEACLLRIKKRRFRNRAEWLLSVGTAIRLPPAVAIACLNLACRFVRRTSPCSISFRDLAGEGPTDRDAALRPNRMLRGWFD